MQLGVLNRVVQGKFQLGKVNNYLPELSAKISSLNKILKGKFPFLYFCIWNTSVLNEFMIHQPDKYYLLTEVEKESMESVFFF